MKRVDREGNRLRPLFCCSGHVHINLSADFPLMKSHETEVSHAVIMSGSGEVGRSV
jgi:hypothetical protein